jgi:hypothetical protein
MNATLLEQARAIVAKYRGQRVRIRFEASTDEGHQRDAHILEGRLRGLITWRGESEPWGFTIVGRCTDWPRDADQFRADPVAFAEALRSAARAQTHYVPLRFADQIEPAPQGARRQRRRFRFKVSPSGPATLDRAFVRKLVQLTHPDRHDGSALATEVTATLNALVRRDTR